MACCRCGDINSCNEDINRLNSALNGFRNADGYSAKLQTAISEIMPYYKFTFSTGNYAALSRNTATLDDDLYSVRDGISAAIWSKISDIESYRSQLQSEDNEYHAQENTYESDNGSKGIRRNINDTNKHQGT